MMSDELRAILSEPGWWSHDDGDLFVWKVVPVSTGPMVRVAFEDGDWWVTCETDGSTSSDLDALLAVLICMMRVHRAIGTPLGHLEGTMAALSAMAREGE